VIREEPPAFWEAKSLSEMSPEEWEGLCDGCGLCCLLAIKDTTSGDFHRTCVACPLMTADGRCGDYANRTAHVPECVPFTPETIGDFPQLPETCAYRRLHEGRQLPEWHPLLTGDRLAVPSPPEHTISFADLTDPERQAPGYVLGPA
jgi:uncharacterized protein